MEGIDIPWLKPYDGFQHTAATGEVGGYIYRIFTHEYKVTDPQTKRVTAMKTDISVERYTIIAINGRIVTISELGRKSDGTYGYRTYDRTTGQCLDDKVPPSNKSRRSIKRF